MSIAMVASCPPNTDVTANAKISSMEAVRLGEPVTSPPVFLLTLDVRVEKHVHQRPAQGGGGGLSASTKQVKYYHTKVAVIETALRVLFSLKGTKESVIGPQLFAGETGAGF